jgi:hypothetical protein
MTPHPDHGFTLAARTHALHRIDDDISIAKSPAQY